MPDNSDADLLKELFETYREMMFKTAKGILCNDFNAEDAVQEAFLHIINNLDRISQISIENRGSYLNKVVTNVCYDLVRNKNRRHECNIDDFELCSGSSADDEVLSMLTIKEIRNMLNELPKRDQEILYLYLFNGYSPKDVAKSMGIPKRQISTYIERARKRLIKLLKERGITNDV